MFPRRTLDLYQEHTTTGKAKTVKKLMDNFKNLMMELMREPEPFNDRKTHGPAACEEEYQTKFCSLRAKK